MHLVSLRARDFRNFRKLDLKLSPGINLIQGANAQGKTNLLEAVYVISKGSSFRADDHDLVRTGAELYSVSGEFVDDVTSHTVTVSYEPQTKTKLLKKDEGRIGAYELAREFLSVVFTPEDLRIVLAEPAGRRNLLDSLLCLTSFEYKEALAKYRRAVMQRAQVLYKVREGFAHGSELEAWDETLARYGSLIIRERYQLVSELNPVLNERYNEIADDNKIPLANYISALDDNVTEREYYLKLEQSKAIDLKMVHTTIGPHRDDVVLRLDNDVMAKRSSRGEIRSVVLALKMCEQILIERALKERPILLLDDVFSELDARRQHSLLVSLTGHQAIITSTQATADVLKAADELITIQDGELERVSR